MGREKEAERNLRSWRHDCVVTEKWHSRAIRNGRWRNRFPENKAGQQGCLSGRAALRNRHHRISGILWAQALTKHHKLTHEIQVRWGNASVFPDNIICIHQGCTSRAFPQKICHDLNKGSGVNIKQEFQTEVEVVATVYLRRTVIIYIYICVISRQGVNTMADEREIPARQCTRMRPWTSRALSAEIKISSEPTAGEMKQCVIFS